MANDVCIKGSIYVIVDPVDIEQAEIESPIVLGQSASIKAMIAARRKDSFKAISSAVGRNNHTLEYDGFEQLPKGYISVTFRIREKNKEETQGRETFTESFNRIFQVK